jgi:hypothetical protein
MSYLELAKSVKHASASECNETQASPYAAEPQAEAVQGVDPVRTGWRSEEEQALLDYFLAQPVFPSEPFALRPGETVTNVARFQAHLYQRIEHVRGLPRRPQFDDVFAVLKLVKQQIESQPRISTPETTVEPQRKERIERNDCSPDQGSPHEDLA